MQWLLHTSRPLEILHHWRIYWSNQLVTGQVITDGINISTVDLQRSRRAMSVITQNPVLFTSSLRMNLDPFEEHDNRDLWNALEKANLKNMVEMLPRQLHKEICECGANFSVSERQLLCLARSSLKEKQQNCDGWSNSKRRLENWSGDSRDNTQNI